MIHRDVKAANILLNTLGQVKLTDFGISRQMQDSMDIASTFIGTKVYM